MKRRLEGIDYLLSDEKQERDAARAARITKLYGWMVEPARHLLARELAIPYNDTILWQDRVVPGGNTITIPKLVTLPKQVQQVHEQKAAASDGPADQTAQTLPDISDIKGTHDPRAKFFGRMIRKLGIDEFPQLELVQQGLMRYVSVRAMLEKEMPHYEAANPVRYTQWQRLGNEANLLGGMVGESQYLRHYYTRIGPVERDHVMELDIQWMLTASPEVDDAIADRALRELLASSRSANMRRPQDAAA